MLVVHKGLGGAAARARMLELLRLVGLASAESGWTPIRTSSRAASASA